MNTREKKEILNIKDILEQVGSRADLSHEKVVEILLEAINLIFTNDFYPDAKLDLVIEKNEKGKNEVNLYILNKLVVDYEDLEKSEKIFSSYIDEAKKIDENLNEGDTFKEMIPFSVFDSKTFKKIYNVFTQNIKEYLKEYQISKHKNLEGQIVRAKIEGINFGRNNKKMASLKIDHNNDFVEAIMPDSLQNPNIELEIGKYINVYVESLKPDIRGLRVVVSNTSEKILENILKIEIPEISSGSILIKSIKRIPGIRSKIAVYKADFAPSGIEPMGAIVGPKGSRINKISEELGGEKIDVILYNENLEKFIINAISPSNVASINKIDDEANNHFQLIVPDSDNTKAIGKSGQNVKLAAGLTETRLDIISISDAKEKGINFIYNGNIDENNNLKNYAFSNRQRNNRDFNYKNRNNNFNFDTIMADFDKEVETYKTNILSLQEEEKDFIENININFSKANKMDKVDYDNNKQADNILNNETFYIEKEKFDESDFEKISNSFKNDSDITKYDDLDLGDLNLDDEDW